MDRAWRHSIRVRGDKLDTGVHYIADASGERLSSEKLKDDDEPDGYGFGLR
jgi:hypothetical protein